MELNNNVKYRLSTNQPLLNTCNNAELRARPTSVLIHFDIDQFCNVLAPLVLSLKVSSNHVFCVSKK